MNEVVRIVTFAGIGIFNSLFDIILWKFLLLGFNKSPKLTANIQKLRLNNYSFAHSISFSVAVILSFFLNKTFTFSDTNQQSNLQIGKFFAVSVFSWFLTTLFLSFLVKNTLFRRTVNKLGDIETSITNRPSIISKNWDLIAKICTISVSLVTNYLGYRFLVF